MKFLGTAIVLGQFTGILQEKLLGLNFETIFIVEDKREIQTAEYDVTIQ